jgi:hypothetical protein
MKIHFLNIFPNLYWFFIEVERNNQENNSFISHRIKQFCKDKEINKIVRLDQDTSYWNKFNMYHIDVQKKIFDMESQKMKNYIETKIAELKQYYFNFQKTLIISNNHTDTAIILFIYLLKHLCNMDYKQSLLSIQSKMNSKIVIQNINTKLLLKKDFM